MLERRTVKALISMQRKVSGPLPCAWQDTFDAQTPSALRLAVRWMISRAGEVPGLTTVGWRMISLMTEAPCSTMPTADRMRPTSYR